MYENFNEASYLVQATLFGDTIAVKDAIWVPYSCDRADVNESDALKRSPLHAAAYCGQPKIAETLISAGARTNCKDMHWFTPLHLACYSGHKPTVDVLLKHNAAVNARDRLWHTPLHIAVVNNALDCVRSLLPFVTNIDVTDREGRTSLHHAAYNQLADMCEFLIQCGSAVNACDKRYRRPLHWAVQRPYSQVPELLIMLGADVNARDKDQLTALHACSDNSHYAHLLLDAGAEIDAKTIHGNTPLHVACLNGYADIVQELLNYNAPLEDANNNGETPLMLAAASLEGDACMNILLEEGANVNTCSKAGQSALHRATRFGRFQRAARLLSCGVEVDIADCAGVTPLHIAASLGHDLLCSTLISKGADVRRCDAAGRTALHRSCRTGSVECCRLFLKHGIDLDVQDSNGMTALHIAALKKYIHCLELLVSSGASLNIPDKNGRIALHYAAANASFEAVYSLMFFGSDCEIADRDGCLPLHFAAAADSRGQIVEYLLKHCSDVNVIDSKHCTPLLYGVLGGNVTTVEHIVAVPNVALEIDGLESPVSVAVAYGYSNILRLLLPITGSKLRFNSKGESAIELAAGRGDEDSLELLLEHFATPPRKTLQVALCRSIIAESVACVSLLLSRDVDVDQPDEEGRTPLFRAAFSGSLDIVELLIGRGADIYHRDKCGKNVMHVAAQCGRVAVLTCLFRHRESSSAVSTQPVVPDQSLANEPEPDTTPAAGVIGSGSAEDSESRLSAPAAAGVVLDSQNFSLLHWALHRCQPSCVELLLTTDNGMYAHWGEHPFTPVHAASMHANKRCLALLIQAAGVGVVTLRDHKGRTPLHIATICNSVSCMRLLLSLNADTDAVDDAGRTPYHIAARGSLTGALTLLLQATQTIASPTPPR